MSIYFKRETDPLLITVKEPTPLQLYRLEYLLNEIDLPRKHFNIPFIITSGLRPPKKKYSQHEDGYAADYVPQCESIAEVFKWIVKFCRYDQVILETQTTIVKGKKSTVQWIHQSLKEIGNRQQAATIKITIDEGIRTESFRVYRERD